MSVYLKVKRHKTTYFIQSEETSKILDVKNSLQELTGRSTSHLRLFCDSKGGKVLCEDDQTIERIGLASGSVLYLVFPVGDPESLPKEDDGDGEENEDGMEEEKKPVEIVWEEVEIPGLEDEPLPLGQEEDGEENGEREEEEE
eukprot:TRINITY_DN82319_c0_g1_i1.p2 TRINITY_DN82319_c0_g1~~TRINITY_DN82319_c0_g1_i1.p2  ORF type:complete len:143 (-),score=57.13 TRINITY_DN82319_c0_g1_i1:128-556(-)